MTAMFHRVSSFGKVIFLSGLIVPIAYIGGILALSLLSNVTFNEVIVYKYFPAQYLFPHLVNCLIKPLTIISGLLLIICFPGIFFTNIFIKEKSNFSYTKLFSLGFTLNIFLLFLGTTLIKLFGIAIDRFWFTMMILILTLVGAVISFKSHAFSSDFKASGHRSAILCFFLLFFVLISFVMVFHDSVLRPLPVNFNYSEEVVSGMDFTRIGDPQEEFGIAYHLKNRILPYWLINSLNEFGIYIYRPHLSFFFNFFTVTLFGQSYASFNFLALIFVLGTFFFVYKIVQIGGNRLEEPLLYICLGFFTLSFLLLLMRSERRPELPFMVWPENLLWGTDNCLWVFLMMGTILFLLKKDIIFTFMFSFLAVFCRYESIPYIFILIALNFFIFKENRIFLRKLLKYYSIFVLLFCAYLLVLCISHGEEWTRYFLELLYNKVIIRFDFTHHLMSKNFDFITVEEKIRPYFTRGDTRDFIRSSLLATYFFVIIFLFPSRDKIVNFVSAFGLIYFFSVVWQSHKIVAYVYLLVPLAATNIRRYIYPPIKTRLFNTMLYIIILVICIYYFNIRYL